MRLALVSNHKSGGATDPARIAELLAADGAEVECVGIDEHERVAGLRPDRVVVAGGDGSLGPVASVCAEHDLAMAVVPTGTANDFARALELPMDPDEAAALARAPEARMRRVELHRAAGRPFLNVASTGLSVDAAENADGLKGPLGPLAYAVGALRAGATGDAIDVEVRCDGEVVHRGPAWQVIVAGTGAFGGGSSLDVADPADGALDVAVLAAGSRGVLVRIAGAMRRGDLAEQHDVVHARGRSVEVAGAGQFNVDGEVCAVDGGRFEHRGERVRVVVGR